MPKDSLQVHMVAPGNGWVTDSEGMPIYKIVPKRVADLLDEVINQPQENTMAKKGKGGRKGGKGC